jgi:uncharacterized protein YcbK (DUF882 family)
MKELDWNLYPNFSKSEFDCKHTGKNEMKHSFMDRLQALRDAYGKPMVVSSGFRDYTHPVEVKKPKKNGAHPTGLAVDIKIARAEAYELIGLAIKMGFTGIGINQRGGSRFIHLDTIESSPLQPRPTVWSY